MTNDLKVYGAIPQFIAVMSYFPGYSYGNQKTILAYNPRAKLLKTYDGWKIYDRLVDRGAKGIPLTVPYGMERADKKDAGFKKKFYFDITQTSRKNRFARIVNEEPYRLRDNDFYRQLAEIFSSNPDYFVDQVFEGDPFLETAYNAAAARFREDYPRACTETGRFLSMTTAAAVMKHYGRENAQATCVAEDLGRKLRRKEDADALTDYLRTVSGAVNGMIDETDYLLGQQA